MSKLTFQDYRTITYIQTALIGLVAFTALFRYKRKNNAIKLIGLLNLYGFLVQVFGLTLPKIIWGIPRGVVNNFMGTTYDFALIILLTQFYNILLKKKYQFQLTLVTIAFCSFALINFFFIQTNGHNSFSHLLASVVIIIYAIMYFYQLMVDLPETNLYRFPLFWINTALLFFHSTAFFIYAFSDYLIKVLNNNLIVYYSGHNILSSIECCIILYALYLDLGRTRNPQQTG